MFENLRRDAERYARLGGWYRRSGFWIGAVYRLGVWGNSLPTPLLRVPVRVLYRLVKLLFWHYNVHLWAGATGARIGSGLCLIHPTNVMIGSKVEIGENCLIFHGVTLGTGPLPGNPKIGKNVDIYTGACILGGVVVGDHCMIGANCVVTRDVPPDSVVILSPTRVLPRGLSPIARGADGEKAKT